MAATEATAYGYPAMHGGMFSGGIAGQAMGAGGGMNGLAECLEDLLHARDGELQATDGRVRGCRRRRVGSGSVFQCIPREAGDGHVGGDGGIVPVLVPDREPSAPPADKPSPLKEPTEALIRASSWKDEAKSLFGSPNVKDFEEMTGLTRIGSGHLPKWVLESFNDGKSSPGAIAA